MTARRWWIGMGAIAAAEGALLWAVYKMSQTCC